MSQAIQPYRIQIPGADLEDLRRRLGATRWPDPEPVDDGSQGIPLAYVQEVCATWANDYDWRKTEARLNAFDQYRAEIDGVGIHFLHLPSPHSEAYPLLMTHGWPGSIVEFLEVIAPLTDPTAHGGQAADAFHLVLPTLPGFGFSDKPQETGWTVEKIATAWAELMARLGYEFYFAQGGDWGAVVTGALAQQDREHCHGIHLNMPLVLPDPATMNDLTDEEKDALAAIQHYQARLIAESHRKGNRWQVETAGSADPS